MKKSELLGFRIYRQESLPESFKRVIREQLQQSLLLCGRYSEAPDFATHEIRKSTKRIRAVYRLYRRVTGDESYTHGRNFYSDLSHILAEHRISIVHIDTLRLLLTEKTLPVNPVFLNLLITEHENHHKQLTAKIFKKQQADQYLAGIITAEIKATSDTPMLLCDFHDLASGLKKTYGQGKKCLDLVMQHPTTENYHELRKIVKSLWNQLILIRPIWPSYISLTVHHLDTLAQRLGLEHDLAELEQYFRLGRAGKDESQVVVLLDFIAKKRQRIQRAIRPLAMRLYAEKPAMMAEKMEKFYRLFVGVS